MFNEEKSVFGSIQQVDQKWENEEKSPIKILLANIKEIAIKMKKKGLEKDAEIVQKIEDRFHHYIEVLRARKKGLEEVWSKQVLPQDLLKISDDRWRINNMIPVTHQIGANEGYIYSPEGFAGTQPNKINNIKETDLFGESRIELSHTKPDHRIINFSFSKEGETEFYQALGILKENESSADIPIIYQETIKKGGKKQDHNDITQINIQNYEVYLPTNIEGVKLHIKKDEQRLYDGKKEEQVSFMFDNEFLEAILTNK